MKWDDIHLIFKSNEIEMSKMSFSVVKSEGFHGEYLTIIIDEIKYFNAGFLAASHDKIMNDFFSPEFNRSLAREVASLSYEQGEKVFGAWLPISMFNKFIDWLMKDLTPLGLGFFSKLKYFSALDDTLTVTMCCQANLMWEAQSVLDHFKTKGIEMNLIDFALSKDFIDFVCYQTLIGKQNLWEKRIVLEGEEASKCVSGWYFCSSLFDVFLRWIEKEISSIYVDFI